MNPFKGLGDPSEVDAANIEAAEDKDVSEVVLTAVKQAPKVASRVFNLMGFNSNGN